MMNLISNPAAAGEFTTLFASGGAIASGQTGTLLTLTPPSGQRVRITHLSTNQSQSSANVTLKFDNVTLITGAVDGLFPLSTAQVQYSNGKYQPYLATSPPMGNHKFITGKANEVFSVISTSTIAATIYYGYEFGI